MTLQRYRNRPGRFLRDHDDDDGVRRALAEGTPAAIATAVARIREEEAVALDQLRAPLRP